METETIELSSFKFPEKDFIRGFDQVATYRYPIEWGNNKDGTIFVNHESGASLQKYAFVGHFF